MAYTDIKNKIDLLRDQITAHGKLTPDQLKKINYKFRLEWNYNSNSMEGNTLTIEETRSVMVGNIDVHQKPYKDVAEMKGHDAVVADILKIGKGELRLSESRVKQIHEDIMYEEDEDKKAQIGKWKRVNNYIYNYKGERFDFVDFNDVPDKIHDLLNRTNAAIDAVQSGKKNAPHPLDVAFNFHLEYVNIHPFYDGNGRTARILTNLILISLGYSPFWITEPQRAAYSNYLGDIQGYGGDPDLFNNFLGELVLASQQLIIDVLEGREIEADDDLDKEIAIWKRGLEKKDELISRSNLVIANLYKETLRPLFVAYLEGLNKFDDLFDKKFVYNYVDSEPNVSNSIEYFDNIFEGIINLSKIPYEDRQNLEIPHIPDIRSLKLYVGFNGFKNDGTNTFSKSSELNLLFDQYKYMISDQNSYDNSFGIKLYSEKLSSQDVVDVIKIMKAKLFENIKASIIK